MNRKYTWALIFLLQVSTSLCGFPQPTEELLEKYNAVMRGIGDRIGVALHWLDRTAGPTVTKVLETEEGQQLQEKLTEVRENPEFVSAVDEAIGLSQEAEPFVKRAHTSALGVYGYYLRPYIKDYVDGAINRMMGFLDDILPSK